MHKIFYFIFHHEDEQKVCAILFLNLFKGSDLVNILCIGDVVGLKGCEFLRQRLPTLKKQKGIDLVIANGENSADGNGVTPSSAVHLFDSGVDLISLGNHTFRRNEVYSYLDETENIIRPSNFPKGAPGNGYTIYDMGRIRVLFINLMGQAFIDSVDCPFRELDKILSDTSLPKIKILDFHAEATGEKRAMGFYADGRISAMFGTHTHVQTADATILPKGTGYITDVGMTGSIHSVLGVQPSLIIKKLMTKMPTRFDLEVGAQKMDCCLFDIDEKTGLCISCENMSIL